jgi:hypothetical protein
MSQEQPQKQTTRELITDYIQTMRNLSEISERYVDRSIEMVNVWTGIKNQSKVLIQNLEQQLALNPPTQQELQSQEPAEAKPQSQGI